MPCSFACVFLRKEGGIQVLAVLASSSQTVGSLLRTFWSAKPAKSLFGKFTSMGNCTPLLLIESIQLSQKFDIPSYYLQEG